MGLREHILAAKDRRIEPVPVPEWGGGIFIRTLTHAERRRAFEAGKKDDNLFLALVIAAVVCDEIGAPIFTEADAQALTGKSGAVLDRIFNAWMKLQALGAGEIAEIEKKRSMTPTCSSDSSSVSTASAAPPIPTNSSSGSMTANGPSGAST